MESIQSVNGVFVSGIPYETTQEDLEQIFSECGTIIELKLPKYQDSGRNIGYAHIYFEDNSNAEKALELDHHQIGKRYLTVQLAKHSYSNNPNTTDKFKPNDVPSDCLTVYVKNLPYDITEEEVGNKFRSCGKIKGIRFVYNSQLKHFKGFCFIDFIEHKSLLKALELNGKEIKGRKMIVDFEVNKAKKSYKFKNDSLSKYNYEQINLLNKKRKKE